jgi:hypothetical protein
LQQRTGQISSAAVRSLLNASTIQCLKPVDERSDSIVRHSTRRNQKGWNKNTIECRGGDS